MFITQHAGKKGLSGKDGDNGLGVESQSFSQINSPYFSAFRKNKLDKSIQWLRSSDAAYQDRYNKQTIVEPKQSKQVINYTTVDEVNWLDPFGYDVWEVTATGVNDPFSENNAVEITIGDTTAEGRDYTLVSIPAGVTIGSTYRISAYIQLVSGTISSAKAGLTSPILIPDGNLDISDLDATWRRLDVIVAAPRDNEFNLYFETTGAVINIYQINVTLGTALYDPINSTGTAPITFNTNSIVYRENDKGFLIEPSATNLCLHSENLDQWSVSGGATVSLNDNFDSFGSSGSNTVLTFSALETVTLTLDSLSLTSGNEYSVSFIANVQSGDVASIGVSLGGGEVEGLQATKNDTRQRVKVVAGESDSIVITVTPSQANTVLSLIGVQIEENEATGYIPTQFAAATRSPDIVLGDVASLPSLAQPFSIHCKYIDVFKNEDKKYFFNVSNRFFAYLENENLVIYANATKKIDVTLDNIESGEFFIVFDNSSLSVYTTTKIVATISYTGETIAPESFYIGASDNAGTNSLNGVFSDLTFWNFALTQNEIKFINGDL